MSESIETKVADLNVSVENPRLYHADCMGILKDPSVIEDHSVDLVLNDPPYGVTAMEWDTPLKPIEDVDCLRACVEATRSGDHLRAKSLHPSHDQQRTLHVEILHARFREIQLFQPSLGTTPSHEVARGYHRVLPRGFQGV